MEPTFDAFLKSTRIPARPEPAEPAGLILVVPQASLRVADGASRFNEGDRPLK